MANGYLKPKLRGRSENLVSASEAARTLGTPLPPSSTEGVSFFGADEKLTAFMEAERARGSVWMQN